MRIRAASAADVPAITEIYNDVILTSDAIWIDEEVSLADRMAWFTNEGAAHHVVLVALDDEDRVVGYGSLGSFRSKAGYWPSVEHSIHLDATHRGQGIGQELLDALTARAVADGRHVMVAAIDGGNTGSIRFHERNGFRVVAEMPGVGRKFGRSVDLILMQKELHPADSEERSE